MSEFTLDDHKEYARIEINQFHADTLKALTGNATIEERDTWPSKEAAARAFMKNEADKTQMEMLTIECQFTGEDIMTLSVNIIDKSEQFRRLVGLASGFRRKAMVALTQCKTIEDIQSLLDSLKSQAEELIGQNFGQ